MSVRAYTRSLRAGLNTMPVTNPPPLIGTFAQEYAPGTAGVPGLAEAPGPPPCVGLPADALAPGPGAAEPTLTSCHCWFAPPLSGHCWILPRSAVDQAVTSSAIE